MDVSRKKLKFFMLINELVAILLAIGIVVLLNKIISDHFFRIDVSSEQYYTLSNATKQLLAKLDKDVKIIVFTSFENELLPEIRSLLKNYVAES